MDPRQVGRQRVAFGQCVANAAAERIDHVFLARFFGRGTNRARWQPVTEAPIGPARGSQPGAQAGRHALKGRGNDEWKWRYGRAKQ